MGETIRDKKLAVEKWDDYRLSLFAKSEIPQETPAQKGRRKKEWQSDFVKFSKGYFPKFCTAEFADFHLEFIDKVVKNKQIYLAMAWAREHAKSVVSGLLLPMFLKSRGELKNMLLVSNSKDNADRLLEPLMLALEKNPLYIYDYGKQVGKLWTQGEFITKDGVAFRGIGAGQSPRGTRNESFRPDFILIDDIDTDEEVRNGSRINKKWDWIEKALFPTMSISGTKRFVLVGNIIGKDCIMIRAKKMADYFKKINILDKKGNPSWHQRYSKKDVDYMLSKISYNSAQQEYFNNPITEGAIFDKMVYGKCPPLQRFKYLICYTDPSYKDHKKADYKATVLMGYHKGKYYILKTFAQQTTTENMIKWHYEIKKWVGDKTSIYFYIEANMLQEYLLEKFKDFEQSHGFLGIKGDYRKKPEKYSRIESLLEPLNRNGKLILNIYEKDNPNMKILDEQFINLDPQGKSHDDCPDAVEGAVYILNKKIKASRFNPVIGKYKRGRR